MNQLSQFHRDRVQAVLAASPLVPVITVNEVSHALPLCEALVAGGIRVLEITLRTPHGIGAIEQVSKEMPDVWVGAGTVTSVEQYREVEAAGAQFVITPGVTEAILDYGLTSGAPLLPGVSTVSELMLGYGRGYREFKFFPAEVAGGIPALKAYAGPFPDVTFCPTGGIRRSTARDYLALDHVAAVGGTWLTPSDAMASGDWAQITEIVRGSLAELKA